MTRLEQLKEKLAARQPVCGTTCGLVLDPILLSKMDHPYMDFMLFDAEHGRYDAQNLVPMLHMCRMMGLPSIVRIQDAFYHLAAKPLDMGADGIMVPRTETVEQLKAVIDGLCFHPVGRKGNGGNLQFYPGESIAHFNSTRILMPQIESPRGIAKLPAMLDAYADHISAVMIGPYDMSVMVGTPLDIYSDVMTASIQQVFDIARSYHKSCGIFCNTPDDADRFHKMGANVYWTGADVQFLQMGIDETFTRLAQIG